MSERVGCARRVPCAQLNGKQRGFTARRATVRRVCVGRVLERRRNTHTPSTSGEQ
ncbi:hypothetical protein QFZ66_007486 [Streptomyces sp. B4I13]|uniref:hypothetical protein n=1 Tax=Streptomyces sp. B4I13 TaxID=3042271 RepID=UPI00278228D7|nr:hypothetical protein [Streptomyces sp. B4I13]MDQ0963608.1 hypothetical protein [Streptomyces sp. B4I13]